MRTKNRSLYGRLPLVLALTLALAGCGAGQTASEQDPSQGTLNQDAPGEETLPPPPEPAEAPPLTGAPEGEVVEVGAAPDRRLPHRPAA